MGLVVQIGADLSKFEREMKNATKDISYLGDKLGKAGGTLTKSLTVPILGAGVAAGKFAMDFDSSFAKVNTLLADGTDLEAYKKSIINASSESGIALGEYTDAVQEAISSDIKQEEAIAFTTQAMKLAKGGFTTGATAVDILTTAINGYGLEAEEAAHLSDVLILTQNYGKTTVDELAQSMGKAIPVAANANFSMEELSTGMAVLTKNGIATAEAGTYMTSMLAELTKSGSISDKTLKELAGKGFAELKKEGMSTTDILGLLNTEAVANGKTLKDMFGNVNAANGALTILKDTGTDYNEILNDMTTNTGAANKAAEIISATAEERLKSAFNELKNTMTELGATLLPVVTACAEGLSGLVNWFNNLSPAGQTFMGVVILLAAAIGPLILMVSKCIEIYKAYKVITTAVKAINIATTVSMFGLTVPIWAVIAVVALVVGSFVLLAKKMGGAGEAFAALGKTALQFLVLPLQLVWTFLIGFTKYMIEAISGMVKIVVGLFTGDFQKVGDGVKQALSAIPNLFVDIFGGAINTVKNAINKILGFFNFTWKLPDLKMPHFSMTGSFSLSPPSIPKIGVDWYSSGGIFTKPTVLGGGVGVGDALNGKGNGAEAVLPLKKLPELLGLDKQNNSPQMITTVVQLDGREIARATSGYMDTELRKNRDGKSRANGGV